jgi:hypothetical protein
MASLADLPEIIGFFSYSRDDDEDSHNALSTIRALVQNELRARLGRSRQSLRLWQDQEAIAPGSMWESQINAAVQQSVFFIPIITPRVINSKYCGVEFKRFLDREKELRRDDLVFPILYIDVDELQDENQWRGHPLLEVIGQRQYVDWREYRYESESPALRRAVASLCSKITTALRRPPPNEKSEADDRAAAQQEAERVAREHADEKCRRDAAAERARVEEEAQERAKAAALRLKSETNRNEEMQRQKRQQEEEPPKVKEEAELRTTAAAPSNITFLQVVCALLVLQGIGRFGYGINFNYYPTIQPRALPFILILMGWGVVGVVIAYGIARQRRWTRVLGLIAVGIGAFLDIIFTFASVIWQRQWQMDLRILVPLSAVIDVVVLIYLIRVYRPVSRTPQIGSVPTQRVERR